jgi:hypothetical protein
VVQLVTLLLLVSGGGEGDIFAFFSVTPFDLTPILNFDKAAENVVK